MFNVQKHLRHVVLALGLVAANLTAGAAVLPTYQIGIADTATSDIASIDLLFSSIDGAAPVTASLSHFVGEPLFELDRTGAVSGTTDGFTIGNAGSYNDLFLAVGGPFAFYLNFSEDFLGFASNFDSNSFFSIALYDSNSNLIGDPNGALNFSLSKTGVVVTSNSSLLSLTQVNAVAVPEPADWALMLIGLVFMVYLTRRNGRAIARLLAAA
ncbi:MAG: NF038129 family PEP-CTERM protein [Janthinobacterium lividum]|uniref:PEP-CTERM protein-sorting domain-containing protein n=1 Tax=Massilia yuzhufengensis TaxID=1164594 RepID=A0A1I1VV39_9BURK|nr:NF038129 family PEP-CTERM protein [Massilia yuzhufengensis]SFD86771.1 PEP-CTERM protein-sorting domain-containing protein [Massilia yuzhufengensis]